MRLAALSLLSLLASQSAQPADPAPAPAAAGRRYMLAEPTKAHFTVMTNIGELSGTVDVVRVDARGLDWGPFELWVEVDPRTLSCRDPVLDRHFARTILRADEGPIVFGSSERITPKASAAPGANSDDQLPGARFYLDARRGGRMVEGRMKSTVEGDQGRVWLKTQGTLAALGLPPSSHPFIEVTGPLVLELDAPVVRRR
jgi:hypothetical protein